MGDPPHRQPPRAAGPYRLQRRLGAGGMGVVYLGQDEATGTLAAVKLIRPEHAADPEFRARLAREVTAARRVPRFCTAPVLAADLAADPPWVATEYIDGPSLDVAVLERGPLAGAELVGFASAVAAALRAIHEQGVIHRDLKPSNILLSPAGPRVIDFGIARVTGADTALTRTGVVIGTPAYLAPEQLTDDPLTPAVDVFAWGSVVTYAATGHPAFGPGTAPAAILGGWPDLGDLTEPLRSLVMAALDKNPAHRPTAADLVDRLARHAAGPTSQVLAAAADPPEAWVHSAPTRQESLDPPPTSPARVPPPDEPPPARRSGRRRWVVAATVLTLAAAAAAPAPYLLWRDRAGPDLAGGGIDPTRSGGSITWLIGPPTGWFPLATGTSLATNQVVSGIVPHTGQTDPAGQWQYNLDLLAAEPQLHSEDPMVFEFRLREEAIWSDGTPISADDFRALWYLGADPEHGYCEGCTSRDTSPFDRIAGIEEADAGRSVIITLKPGEVDPHWWSFASVHSPAGGLVPWHLAADQGWDLHDPADVGRYFDWLSQQPPRWSGGPFQVVLNRSDLDQWVVWERNPRWYGTPPPLQEVELRVGDVNADPVGWRQEYAGGFTHGASPAWLEPPALRQLREDRRMALQAQPGGAWLHLNVNLAHPHLADRELRRAIFTAIDVAEVMAAVGGTYPETRRRLNPSFPEGHPHFEDVLTGTGFGAGNVALARQLLADAGYHLDDGTLWRGDEPVGRLRLRTTGSEPRLAAARAIQQQLATLGIPVDVDGTELTFLRDGDYDLALFGWFGSPALPAGEAYRYGHRDSGNNFGRYANVRYDQRAEAAMAATSPGEVADRLNEAYRILLPDAYLLPLYEEPVFMFVAEGYANVRDNPYSPLRALHNAHQWGHAAS